MENFEITSMDKSKVINMEIHRVIEQNKSPLKDIGNNIYFKEMITQLKHLYSFDFIDLSLLNNTTITEIVSLVTNLVENHYYNDFQAKRTIEIFVLDNDSVCNFVISQDVIYLRYSCCTCQELIKRNPFECVPSFDTIFKFIEMQFGYDIDFQNQIKNYLDCVMFNVHDGKFYVYQDNDYVDLMEAPEIKNILNAALRLTSGKLNPNLFAIAFVQYKWFKNK